MRKVICVIIIAKRKRLDILICSFHGIVIFKPFTKISIPDSSQPHQSKFRPPPDARPVQIHVVVEPYANLGGAMT